MPKRKVNKEHDLGYKHLLTHKKTFVELLKSFVKESWANDIDESQVVLINKSYVLQDFKEKESDIVYRLKVKDRDIIFYCLLELQSSVDYQMPLRLLLYMVEIWRDILKNTEKSEARRKDFRLPSIIPIVLYNGATEWTACRSFRETLSGNEMFSNQVLDFNYILFDVNRYSENELLGFTNLISSVFLLDQKIDSEQLKERLVKLAGVLKGLTEEEIGLFKGWFKWIIKPRVSEELQPKIDEILENAHSMEVENMVYNLANTIEELQKKAEVKGEEKGIEKGIEKGEDRKAIKVAEKMLKRGDSIEDVVDITELPIETIINIKKKMVN